MERPQAQGMVPGLKDLRATITLAIWEVSTRARARAETGGELKTQKPQREAGRVGMCSQQVHRWKGGMAVSSEEPAVPDCKRDGVPVGWT